MHLLSKTLLCFNTKKIGIYFHLKQFTRIEVLVSFLSDHSPLSVKTNISKELRRGSRLWKFNNFLLQHKDFVY